MSRQGHGIQLARHGADGWRATFLAPSGSGGILPLADFGTVFYGFDNTTVASTNDATVSGAAGPIGGFGANVQTITMISNSGATKAVPSSLSADGTSFSDQWVSSGP